MTLVLAGKSQIREVSVQNAQTLVVPADPIIDVREPDEYGAGHLAGAIDLPRVSLEFKRRGAGVRTAMNCGVDASVVGR